MEDDKLAADEARREVQHGSVKAQIQAEVDSEIAARAERTTPSEARQMEQVAGEFRSKAVGEVVETEREVGRARGAARVSQFVDYVFYVIYALLGMRFLLNLLGANPRAGFVGFINTVTNPFFAPFKGIVATPSTAEGFRLALPILVAIIAYILLHLAINGLLRIVAHRKTAV
jgi:hypothetical protein